MNTNPPLQHAPEQPARAACRPRRRGRLRRTALAAAVLAGAGGLMLAASGIAFATVDQTSPQWAALGSLASSADQASQVSAVYTIQNVAEPGTEMLEDNGNNMSNGGTVDVWHQIYQTTDQDSRGPEITQANYLWEFVSSDPAEGTLITQNSGELINRQSGLCLDIANNNTADGATIDQWTCNGGNNQQWTAIPVGGSYYLVPLLDYYNDLFDGVTPSLGIGNGSSCTTNGDGDSVYVRTTGTAGNTCDEWTIQQASYDFATEPINVPAGRAATDGTSYGCLTGETLRWHDLNTLYEDPDYTNLGGSDVTPVLYVDSSEPNLVSGIDYMNSNLSEAESGQIMLYCDPATTTP
jgi:hypothetical protein